MSSEEKTPSDTEMKLHGGTVGEAVERHKKFMGTRRGVGGNKNGSLDWRETQGIGKGVGRKDLGGRGGSINRVLKRDEDLRKRACAGSEC